MNEKKVVYHESNFYYMQMFNINHLLSINYFYMLILLKWFYLYFKFNNTLDILHGIDNTIFNMHVLISFLNYFFMCLLFFFFMRLFYFFSEFMLFFLRETYLMCMFISICILWTGIIWGWSQWGIIEFYDMKMIIIFILFWLFLSSYILMYIDVSNMFIFYYNLIILYHMPMLKYNVLWNAEMHQNKTFLLMEFFMFDTLLITCIYMCYMFINMLMLFYMHIYYYFKIMIIK